MTNILSELCDNKGARKSRTRVGRGIGSGKGKTCGRGVKGQKARSGVAIKGFEGGQMPIHRRLPKRGFNNSSRKTLEVVNVSVLQEFVEAKKLDATKPITVDILKEVGLVNANKDGVKLLNKGAVTIKLNIKIDSASKSAVAAVEKAGGTVTIVSIEKVSDKQDSDAKKSSKKAA